MDSSQDDKRIQVTREYFRLADQGRREVLELFHDEAEIYFPKFGFGFGRQSLFEMIKGFDGVLEFIQHDYDKLTFIRAGDYVVVEGTSRGRVSGKTWRRDSRWSLLQCLQVPWRSHFESPCLS